ncbi:hypothetical protein THAOC_19983, partial [Thalassiosira oceanica]
ADFRKDYDGHNLGEIISSLSEQALLLMEGTQGHLAISDRPAFDDQLKELQLASNHDYSDSLMDGVQLDDQIADMFDDQEYFDQAEYLIDIIEQVKLMVGHSYTNHDGTVSEGSVYDPSEEQYFVLAIRELEETVQDYHRHVHQQRHLKSQGTQDTDQSADWLSSKPFGRPAKLIDHLRAANARKRRGNRHRQLKDVSPEQCERNCDVGNSDCLCEKLKDCVKELSPYDLAVRFLGNFIEDDVEDDKYGKLSVEEVSDIQLFDATRLHKKLSTIRELANRDTNEESCTRLLSELYTACLDKNGCTEPNEYSAELSVLDICESKNSRTKVQMKSLGEVFDFQNKAVKAYPNAFHESGKYDISPPDSEEFAYDKKKAVRCCRDDKGDDDWIKPIELTGMECSTKHPVDSVLSQSWTGDHQELKLVTSKVEKGYTQYLPKPPLAGVKCLDKDNKIIERDDPLGHAYKDSESGQCLALDELDDKEKRYNSIEKNINKDGDPVTLCAKFCFQFELVYGYRGFHVKTKPQPIEEKSIEEGGKKSELERLPIGRCACLFDYGVTPRLPSDTEFKAPKPTTLEGGGGSGPVMKQDWNGHWECFAFNGLTVGQCTNLCNHEDKCVSFDMHEKGDGNRHTERVVLKTFVMKSLTVYGPGTDRDDKAAGCTFVEKDDKGDRTLQWGSNIASECQNTDPRQVFLYDAKTKLVHVRSLGMEMCLDLRLDGVGNSNVYFSTCHGGKNQQWHHNEISPDTIKKEAIWVVDPKGHKNCLGFDKGIIKADVKFCTDDDGLRECYKVKEDKTIVASHNDCREVFLFDAKRRTVHVKSLGFAYCLDLRMDTVLIGNSNIYFHECHGGSNQQWSDPYSGIMSSGYGSKCLQVPGNGIVKAFERHCSGYTFKSLLRRHIRLIESTKTSHPVSSVECQTQSTGRQGTDSYMNWYKRKSENEGSLEDCRMLSFGRAVKFCEDKGGRLCTKEELQDGCASMTGCGFDQEHVWSSDEASPKSCQNKDETGNAVSYDTCHRFVEAFDDLYEYSGKGHENPMRNDTRLAAHSVDAQGRRFANARFPTDYVFDKNKGNGVATIKKFDYDFNKKFTEDDHFCGAAKGPPSILVEACDASQEFLLGKEVSVGMLRSYADNIKEGKGEELGEPYWLRWYKTLRHDTAMEYKEKWEKFYNETKMSSEDGPLPDWLEKYTEFEDKNPHVSPTSRMKYYCMETSKTSTDRHIQFCERDWLNQTSNPYEYEGAFAEINIEPELSFGSSSCAESLKKYNFKCQGEWLNQSSLSEVYKRWQEEQKSDDFPNKGSVEYKCVTEFLTDCVESVINPEKDEHQYQCSVFWNECRAKVESIALESKLDWKEEWDKFREAADLGECPHQTCQLEWLHDNADVDKSCEPFKTHCKSELDENFPQWNIGFCNGNKDKTCDVEWLNQTENPYSNDTEKACFDFWSFCYDKLEKKHPDHIYPITHFDGIKTAEDLMPGSCCIDRPGQGFGNTHWGLHYNKDRKEKGMQCRDTGKWNMRMSEEACNKGRGLWFRSPCYTLYKCINDRPLPLEHGYKAKIDDWILSSGIELYDPTDPAQCERAREALGKDKDHVDDFELCDVFKHHLCEDDRFKDKKEPPAGEVQKDQGFKQIKYKPITFPKDKPLYFDKLPDMSQTAFAEAMIDSPEDQSKNKALIKSEGQKQFEYDKLKLGFEKTLTGLEHGLETVEYGLGFKTSVCKTVEQNVKLGDDLCVNIGPVLPLGGGSNPAYVICKAIAATQMGITGNTCSAADKFVRIKAGILIASQWASFIANSITEGLEVNTMRTVATSIADVTPDEVRDSIGTLNKNMLEQHTQMRRELQSRHEEMTNNINQYDRRRRLNKGEVVDDEYLPFTLDAEWEEDSVIGTQSRILEEVDDLEELGEEEKKREARIIDDLAAIKEALKLLSPPTTGQPEQTNRGKAGKKKKSGKVEDDEENLFSWVVEDEEHEEPGHIRLLQNSLSEQIEAQNEKADTKIEMIHQELEAQNEKIDAVDTKVDTLSAKIGKLEDLMRRLLDAQQEQTQE